MKIEIKKLPKSRVKLNIEADAGEMKPYFEEAYKKLASQVNIKGFRSGQAPKLMVIESVGLNRYHSTALDIALPQVYYKAVTGEKIVPICPPSVNVKEISEDGPFVFEAEVDVLPVIKLGDYKKIKLKAQSSKLKINVTKEEIDRVIKRLQYQGAKFTNVERGAKKGDHIDISFSGEANHVKKDIYCSQNYPLILGEGILIPGFEEQLEGMKKDEEKTFNLKVKSPDGEEKVDFTVKMNLVRDAQLPELDNNFSKKFGHDNPDKLAKAIEESISQEKSRDARNKLEQEILQEVAKKIEIEVPQCLIEQEIDRKIAAMQKQMDPVWQQYLDKIKKTVEELRKEFASQAENQVKYGLILGEIARDMGLLNDKIKTQEDQEKVIRETMDKLIEMTTK